MPNVHGSSYILLIINATIGYFRVIVYKKVTKKISIILETTHKP